MKSIAAPRRRRKAGAAGGLVVLAAVALAGCSGGAAGSSGTTTSTRPATTVAPSRSTGSTGSGPPPSSVAPPTGVVVTPADVVAIVAADTSINNRANATLSLSLQDGHETCLQGQMDDLQYRAQIAAGDKSSSPPFDQVAKRPMVPRQAGYPAAFSVVASDVSSGQPTTTAFLTYVRTSASGPWKLASSSFVLGPTAAGVTVPAIATDKQGFATTVAPGDSSGLSMAPGAVPAAVASAFSQEAKGGHLPSGVTAEFGANAGYQSQYDPYQIEHFFASVGTATATYSTTAPPIAAPTAAAPGCSLSYPAYRLAGGGALVEFPIFQRLVLTVRGGGSFTQPGNLQGTPFALLPGGSYSEVTSVQADVCIAVVPPAGSSAPLRVIGQGLEALTQTGVEGGEITT